MRNERELNTDAAILARVIAPHEPTLSPAAAQGLLVLKFGDEDCAKMRELAEKARSGTLTGDEQLVIEGYERVGSLIGLLQSKARQCLHGLANVHSSVENHKIL